MAWKRVLFSIAVIGLALSFANCGKACVVAYQSQSCGGPDFTCSTHINVPVSAWADGGTPIMQPVGCCQSFAATMVGIDFDCYVTKSDSPKTQQESPILAQEVVEVKRTSPLYVPDCDGWLVAYNPIANRSVKPA